MTHRDNLSDIGCYRVFFKGNESRFYIGSTSRSFRSRFASHLCDLRKNRHHSKALQNAYKKYGEQLIVFEILYITKDPEVVIKIEQTLIDELDPEYNCSPTAGSRRGIPASEKQKQVASMIHKGNKYVLGRKQTQEEIARRQLSRKLSGKNKPMLGKKHSAETKEKMSKDRKGRPNPGLIDRNNRPVYCITNDTYYKSIKSAIADIKIKTGLTLFNSNICDVIYGKRKTCKGFKFKLVEKNNQG